MRDGQLVRSFSARRRALLSSQRRRDRLLQLAATLILLVGAIVTVLPFEWMLATSLSQSANIALPTNPSLWPADPSWFNYNVAATNTPLVTFYRNSVLVTVSATAGYLFFSSITGYAFAKGRFPAKTGLFLLFLASMMLPFETRMIPLYLEMRDLHLSNTLAALVLPALAGGFGTFLMRQYISTIPDELIDAARVDGAGEFKIYRSIILPLCGPVLATLAVLTVISRWNEVLWPLLIISDRDLYTVPLGLATATRSQGVYTGVALATTALSIIPLVVVYLLLHRFVIRGIAMTGLKG
jgi:multiple sugar transport system permease protein